MGTVSGGDRVDKMRRTTPTDVQLDEKQKPGDIDLGRSIIRYQYLLIC